MNSPVCCTELDIERRFITPMHPQINGMIERFNGRMEVELQSYYSNSAEIFRLPCINIFSCRIKNYPISIG